MRMQWESHENERGGDSESGGVADPGSAGPNYVKKNYGNPEKQIFQKFRK